MRGDGIEGRIEEVLVAHGFLVADVWEEFEEWDACICACWLRLPAEWDDKGKMVFPVESWRRHVVPLIAAAIGGGAK
jgi:hypothetical protein